MDINYRFLAIGLFLLLAIPVHYANSEPFQPITPCPTIPSIINRSLISSYVIKAQNGDFCALNTLNSYGQVTLKQYNVSINLTQLNVNFNNQYVKKLPYDGGSLSNYENILNSILPYILIFIFILIVLIGVVTSLLIKNKNVKLSSVKTAILGIISGGGISIFYILNQFVSGFTYAVLIVVIVIPIIIFSYLKQGNQKDSKKLSISVFMVWLVVGIIVFFLLYAIPVLWVNALPGIS